MTGWMCPLKREQEYFACEKYRRNLKNKRYHNAVKTKLKQQLQIRYCFENTVLHCLAICFNH